MLNEKINVKLPLAKKDLKLPVVLSREEVSKMIEVTSNIKHKLKQKNLNTRQEEEIIDGGVGRA